MKRAFSIVALFLISGISAQNAARKVESVEYFGDRLELDVTDGHYIIKPYSDNIIETAFIPRGETYKKESHAVVLSPKKVKPKFRDKNGVIEFATGGITVSIKKAPFQISYSYKGKALLSEKEGYIKKDSTEHLSFNLDATESLYGGGARAIGMDRRGSRLQLYNKANYGYGDRAELLNYTIPMVLSSKIYAVHFDNAPIGYLDLDSKKDNTLAYETISGRKTYQIVAADSWIGLIENYTELTGQQPLPPRWAFGNFASRFGYHSQKEVMVTAKKFRDENIPLDAIILDLYWFGKDIKGTLGNLEFYKDSFPDPEKMIVDLKKDNIKTILITEPFVLTTSNRWNEAVSKNVLAADKEGRPYTYDFYFGNTGIIDIFKPEGSNWFWNIYKNLNNMGVAGSWGDLGEPEVHPSYVQHATGSANEVHNIYGHEWAKLVFEGYKKDFPAQRPFILMRSGYSGSQRYGMIPWSGDVGRSWGGLQSQPEISLQMGMQGLGYMHSDLGGFAGDNIDDELYVRWLQYGVFQPIFRPHAQESVPAEPVFRTDKVKMLAKMAVDLRYSMMPYNYTMAFRNSTKGTPLMRPLFFEEPNNIKLLSVADEYLWGDAFLVAPVLKQGITEREVYFPAGSNWFDSATGKKYEGGSTHRVPVSEDVIPVFARGGSLVPLMEKPMQSSEEYSTKDITLVYVYDAEVQESSGMLYDDNGQTPDAYSKGEYEIIRFKSKLRGKKLEILLDAETGKNYKSQPKNITLAVSISNDGEFEVRRKTITWDTKKQGKITIQL